MILEITQWILDSIKAHGAVSVFVGVMIESILIPIPSPIIIMGAGAILIEPNIPVGQALAKMLWVIILPGAVASTLGAYIAYGLAYLGGKPVIDRLSSYLGFDWQDIEIMESRLKKGSVALGIVLLRALPVVPLSLVSAAIGVIRWPIAPFTLWTFVGSLPRCLVLAYLGWLTMDAYDAIARRLDFAEMVVSLLIVGCIGVLILWLRRHVRRGNVPRSSEKGNKS